MTNRPDQASLSLRSRLKQATAREILNAAEQVLAEQGAAASMQAIARMAGVAVGTLYNHFTDKDDLVRGLLSVRRGELFKAVDEAMAGRSDAPFVTQLLTFVQAIFTQFERRRSYLKIAIGSDMPRGEGDDGRPALLRTMDRLRPVIDRGLSEGVLRPELAPLYPPVLAGIIRGVLVHGREDPAYSFTGAAETVVELFLGGAAVKQTEKRRIPQ